ncbi:cytochrome P450 705A5-like [Trifolium pratense]|uniref:cytochrome P450 705A5-like n=1 Tax=Trifolium pratense TaxID=57577 RepID=UPI001E6948D8|nr:cytochrome P450 705A5-like [Trifolium pratense]
MAETLLFLLLILSFFIIAYIIIFFTTIVLHLPPSPPTIHLIGHLHLLTPSLYKSFHSISIKHGPLLHLRLGPSRSLLLVSCASSSASIFKTNDLSFSSRPAFTFADKLPYGTSGFITAPYGPYWRFMKKLCMTELLSGRQLERSMSIRRDEIERSVKRVLENVGVATAVDLGAELMKFTNNVTCRMAMSTRCSEKCEDAEKIRKLVKESFELAAKLCFGDVLGPFKELTFWIYEKRAMDVSKKYDELLEKVLKKHEDKRSSSHRNGDDNERDIMDIPLDVLLE